MPTLIKKPTIIEAAGNKPKKIEEFIGKVNTDNSQISIARMTSPGGWTEPAQSPEFDEYTIVLTGTLVAEHKEGSLRVNAGEAILTKAGEWVRYSTPEPEGAQYIAVCLPAFTPDSVHRETE